MPLGFFLNFLALRTRTRSIRIHRSLMKRGSWLEIIVCFFLFARLLSSWICIMHGRSCSFSWLLLLQSTAATADCFHSWLLLLQNNVTAVELLLQAGSASVANSSPLPSFINTSIADNCFRSWALLFSSLSDWVSTCTWLESELFTHFGIISHTCEWYLYLPLLYTPP